jgi:hypothetical protein
LKKDWNAEWEMEQSAVDDMLLSWIEFKQCDHDWVPTEEVEGALSWVTSVCTKCGGCKGLKPAEGEQEPLIPNEKRGEHCL